MSNVCDSSCSSASFPHASVVSRFLSNTLHLSAFEQAYRFRTPIRQLQQLVYQHISKPAIQHTERQRPPNEEVNHSDGDCCTKQIDTLSNSAADATATSTDIPTTPTPSVDMEPITDELLLNLLHDLTFNSHIYTRLTHAHSDKLRHLSELSGLLSKLEKTPKYHYLFMVTTKSSGELLRVFMQENEWILYAQNCSKLHGPTTCGVTNYVVFNTTHQYTECTFTLNDIITCFGSE
jgi:hypothetical protein